MQTLIMHLKTTYEQFLKKTIYTTVSAGVLKLFLVDDLVLSTCLVSTAKELGEFQLSGSCQK